jgi:hypothetical protein
MHPARRLNELFKAFLLSKDKIWRALRYYPLPGDPSIRLRTGIRLMRVPRRSVKLGESFTRFYYIVGNLPWTRVSFNGLLPKFHRLEPAIQDLEDYAQCRVLDDIAPVEEDDFPPELARYEPGLRGIPHDSPRFDVALHALKDLDLTIEVQVVEDLLTHGKYSAKERKTLETYAEQLRTELRALQGPTKIPDDLWFNLKESFKLEGGLKE